MGLPEKQILTDKAAKVYWGVLLGTMVLRVKIQSRIGEKLNCHEVESEPPAYPMGHSRAEIAIQSFFQNEIRGPAFVCHVCLWIWVASKEGTNLGEIVTFS